LLWLLWQDRRTPRPSSTAGFENYTVQAGSDGTGYITRVPLPAGGTYDVEVANPTLDKYFINYDDFRITPVPEPVGIMLLSLPGCMWHSRPRL
jgi:hypothetical protein